MTSPNPQLDLAYAFVQYTQQHVFLTGKAGTGKTTFLQRLKAQAPKRMVVVAPTGVAAINAGGVTIHSFFQLPFGPIVPGTVQPKRFNRQKIDILRSLDLLVIDEISMVRADLLDGIDGVLRQYRDADQPFGGVQLLMIGDLQQLAPVVKSDEWVLLSDHYETPFFFASQALRSADLVPIELQHIYRQSDPTFIDLLNQVRHNALTSEGLAQLNQRYIPGYIDQTPPGTIILTTHNHQAQQINLRKLRDLPTRSLRFQAQLTGEFPEYAYPTDPDLELKVGAQVMFVKNDPSRDKLFFNGKIGTLTEIIGDTLYVQGPEDAAPIAVTPLEWQNIKYTLDETTKAITPSVAGTFTQYPLKTAWAITIHKSQGLTFERAVIDAQAAFAHGQVYVALSRCKTLEGMVLSAPLSTASLKDDEAVAGFSDTVAQRQPDADQLHSAKQAYQHTLLRDLFDFAPLQQRLGSLAYLARQNPAALHGPTDAIAPLQAQLQREWIDAAQKFGREMQRLLAQNPEVEHNQVLQSRIATAVSWFGERLERHMAEPLAALSVVSDNKVIKKSLTESLNRLREALALQLASLQACRQGFDLPTYLQARALARLPQVEAKTPAADTPDIADLAHPQLYQRLRTWRSETAAAAEVPVFFVLPTAALIAVAETLPSNKAGLQRIKGLGPKKVSQYGAAILERVADYCAERDVAPAEPAPEILEKPKAPKEDTKQSSLDRFRAGQSVAEIAAARGLGISTIEGHLAHYVAQGELPLDGLVAPDVAADLTAYFSTHPTVTLGEAKAHWGERASYGELKLVRASLSQAQNPSL
jgi:hypothetical protein